MTPRRVPEPRRSPEPGRSPELRRSSKARPARPWATRDRRPLPAASRAARTPPAPPPRDLPAHFRRRRRIAAVVLAALVAVVAVGLGGRALLYDTGLADVEGVQVTGTTTVPQPDVLEAAAVTVGVPLAGVDLAAVELRVERIAGVADARAGRDWPHTVTIAVVERVPVAVADTPQGLYLVDGAGVAYLPAPAEAALPKLAVPGVTPDDPATRAALDVLTALTPALREEVRSVEVEPAPTVRVTLVLTRNRQVRWGSPDRGADKAAVLGALLSQSGSVYDVASPELPTIRR